MKIHNWIISALIFIILINDSYATCPEPDISTYTSCTDTCPDAVAFTEDFSKCVNVCIGKWNKIQDEYYSCLKSEREEPEEENPLSEVTYPAYRETSYAINLYKGDVELTRNGVIFPINSDFRVFPGDSIHTGKDGLIEIASGDSLIKLGPNTLGKMLGLDPANARVIPSPAWYEDPNYNHELDNWGFWKKTLIDLGDFIINNRPDYLLDCVDGDIIGCGWGAVQFIYEGMEWFDEKMEEDSKKSMILTPTAVVIPIGTEFVVEVAPDGATTITTLNGTVIVMDLKSRKSVILEFNQKITIPNTSNGLGEQELQQSLTEVNPKSIDKWWIEDTSTQKRWLTSLMLLLIAVIVSIIIFMKVKNLKKK